MGTKLFLQFLVGLFSSRTIYSLETLWFSAQFVSWSTPSVSGALSAFEKVSMLEDSDSDDQALNLSAPTAKKKAKSQATGAASSSEDNLEFSMRGTLQSARFSYQTLKLPWETGFAGRVIGNRSSLPGPKALQFSAAQIPPVPKDVPSPMAGYVFPEQTNATARSRLKTVKELPSEDCLRDRAVLKFRMLIEMDLEATEVGTQMLSMLVTMAEVEDVCSLLQDVFNSKSTATLTKRSNALIKYVLWAKAANLHRPMLMEEPQIYQYLNFSRRAGCAPTMPSSFVQAVSFFGHMVGSQGAKHAAQSSRIRGLCDAEFVKKKPLKQARPLTVAEVMILENLCWNSPSCQDRVAAGQ